MSDQDRDSHPDSPPQADRERRSDLEQATTGANRDIEKVEETDASSAEGVGGENGAGGVVKNQEDMGQ